MARPKSDRELRFRRTTVDLPRLMERQMREAAWQHCRTEDGRPNGMLQRYLIKAVEHELMRDGMWPITLENMPPPTGLEQWTNKVRELQDEGLIPENERGSDPPVREKLTDAQLWPGLYGKQEAEPMPRDTLKQEGYTFVEDAQPEADKEPDAQPRNEYPGEDLI